MQTHMEETLLDIHCKISYLGIIVHKIKKTGIMRRTFTIPYVVR